MNMKQESMIDGSHKKKSCYRIEYFSGSKGTLIICVLISWAFFGIFLLNLLGRFPSNEIFASIVKSSHFYSIGSSEIGRVASINFPHGKVYHVNGIAYDKYSINEVGQTKVSRQWLTFPLPNEINRKDFPSAWYPPNQSNTNQIRFPIKKSPRTKSGLAYVEQIYVITDESFVERHTQLKKTFVRHSIPIESIDFRFKWNRTTCASQQNLQEVKRKLNPAPNNHIRIQQCPIIMKHVDVWYEMVQRKIPLGLILEDDPIFVPFFKEKLNRIIYTAIRTGALNLYRKCFNENQTKINENEWFNQEAMFVIGICFDMFDKSFEKDKLDAQPLITTHKQLPSRCAHAYLITHCAAKAMIETINKYPTNVGTPDFYLNFIFPRSNILQSFWIDPPLVYQGNRVVDLENLQTFKSSLYNKPL